MEEKDYSVKIISKQSGISTKTIYRIIRILSIKKNKGRYSSEQYDEIVKYFKKKNKMQEQIIIEINWHIYTSKMNN